MSRIVCEHNITNVNSLLPESWTLILTFIKVTIIARLLQLDVYLINCQLGICGYFGYFYLKTKSTSPTSYLDITLRHVLQHPDSVGPGIVVAGIAAGSVRAHLHLLVERPGQMVAELLAPLGISLLCFTLVLLL